MKTAAEHARLYPGCRSKTLIDLIQKEKTTERLRKEIATRNRRSWLNRLWRILAMRKAGA